MDLIGKQKSMRYLKPHFYDQFVCTAGDKEVTQALEEQGWLVMRFWGKEIKKNCAACADKVEEALKER